MPRRKTDLGDDRGEADKQEMAFGTMVRGFRFITERIHARGSESSVVKRELAEMQRRYRALVEQLPLASYIEELDASSAGYMSPQIVDLVGYTGEEWAADPDFFGRVLHPDDRDRVLAGFKHMHKEGTAWGCEYRLIAKDGRVVWIHDAAVIVHDDSGRPLYAQGYMQDITQRKVDEASLLENQKLLEAQMLMIEHEALHDALTGLPNRTLMRNRLDEALARADRRRYQVAVMLLDVDDFKLVNDSLGHAAGDEVLVEIAARLRAVSRKGETVARLGGDEFALVAEGLRGEHEVSVLAKRILSVFAAPFRIGSTERLLTGSLGIALTTDASRASDLLRDADVAMYRAKASEKGGYEFFDATFRAALLRKVAVSNALRTALRSDDLDVYFQPVVSIADGRTLAVEALVRWLHPEWGWIQPSEFIPLAEDDGTIVQVGHYVLDRAAEAAARWRKDESGPLPYGVLVNVSARELASPAFAERIRTRLQHHRLSASDLCFEITERVFLDDRHLTVSSNLGELSRMGVRLILDDFGTGYSALASLKRFPLAALKIDRFFIRSIRTPTEHAPITRAVIGLGKSLGMTVIAEGVENDVQFEYLQRLGCDAGQGYFFARALPLDEVSAHLGSARAPELPGAAAAARTVRPLRRARGR